MAFWHIKYDHPQATSLLHACYYQAWDIALLLLSKGADPNKTAMKEDGDVVTPLFYAAKFASIDMCKSLLASGARQDIGLGKLGLSYSINIRDDPQDQIVSFL